MYSIEIQNVKPNINENIHDYFQNTNTLSKYKYRYKIQILKDIYYLKIDIFIYFIWRKLNLVNLQIYCKHKTIIFFILFAKKIYLHISYVKIYIIVFYDTTRFEPKIQRHPT